MAMSPAARAKRKQAKKNYLSDSSYEFKQLFFFQVFTKRPAPFSSQEKNQLSSSMRIASLCTDRAEGQH
jgi:hypothetical protein